MTYGQTIGLTQDQALIGNWAALRWGMLGLAVKGSIWIGFAGLMLGHALGGRLLSPWRMAGLILAMWGAYLLGVWLINQPYDPARRLLPEIYFSADWTWRPDAGPELKPRREVWGGLLLALLMSALYLRVKVGDRLAFHMAGWGMLGGALGFPGAVGLWMVKSGNVDCEGWDIFSYLSGNTGNQSTVGKVQFEAKQRVAESKQKEKTARQLAIEAQVRAESNRRLHEQVDQAIESGHIELAIKLQNRLTAADPSTNWKQNDLYRIVQALLKSKDYEQALPLMEKHIDLFEQNRFAIQVAMMKIWLSQQQPRKTLGYLQGFNPSFLAAEEVQLIKQIAAVARKQIAAGITD
jgi:tetratricopeptide (TPR) repeat protein